MTSGITPTPLSISYIVLTHHKISATHESSAATDHAIAEINLSHKQRVQPFVGSQAFPSDYERLS